MSCRLLCLFLIALARQLIMTLESSLPWRANYLVILPLLCRSVPYSACLCSSFQLCGCVWVCLCLRFCFYFCLCLCEQEATTSLLNRLPTRPYAESYDHPSWALANTYSTAQSPFLQHRHAQAQRRRLQFEVDDPLCGTLQRPQTTGPLREAVTSAQQSAAATAAAKAMNWQSSRPFTTTQGGGAAGARTAMANTTPATGAASESRVSSTPTLPTRVRAKLNRAKTAAAVTHDKLLDFERKQHQKMNFQVRGICGREI